MKFKGSKEDLIAAFEAIGYSVDVSESGSAMQFRTRDGAVVSWYSSTGTLTYQGDKVAAERCKQLLETTLISPGVPTGVASAAPGYAKPAEVKPATVEAKGKVFVVHGHDQTSREQLELILHKLGLDPFVLQNTGGSGLTIIEALEQEIGPNSAEVKFGIVLLTPDDFGYSKSDGADKSQPRARQNVVLEMGMLLSSIGRRNVAILKKGHVDVPSDAQGILYLAFNDHVKETVPRLVDRLTSAGFKLDPSNITKASS
ncbi:TIR domain-containing protein [Achromobacter spanius]|uniref:TIR domain-containing protein n=1 Tax=Achromobacter spanius TaxID=217203 RepID=UPI00320816C4